jgi:NADP-dependent aldehyde dehydrogenase
MLGELEAQDLPAVSPLLNGGIESGFSDAVAATDAVAGVRTISGAAQADAPAPVLFATDVQTFRADMDVLMSEMFGPAALIVAYQDERELVELAARLDGQLTATIVGTEGDEIAAELIAVLSEKAGRVLWNQWPTGVSVTWAQQHGGPYPATTAVGSTSVGMAAITRFLRPVAYQNVPDALLPDALKESNPLGIARRVDGVPVLP